MLLPALRTDDAAKMIPPGFLAPSNVKKALKLGEKPVVYDNVRPSLVPSLLCTRSDISLVHQPPFRHSFGDVLEQPEARYELQGARAANVSVSFVGANPRNDLRLEGTYLEVQQRVDGAAWKVVRTDGHASTLLRWTQTNKATGSSRTDIAWMVEQETEPGVYRIVYRGNSKQPITGRLYGELCSRRLELRACTDTTSPRRV